MKKTTGKKLIVSLLIIMVLAIIGAVLVTAENSNTTLNEEDVSAETVDITQNDENINVETNDETEVDNKLTTFWGRGHIRSQIHFFFDLTEEQQKELDEKITNLREEGASCFEIREAIFAKLDEFGVMDKRLDYEIEFTEKRLEILYRQKELREEGYNWDEIRDIIQEEFDLELPTGDGKDMMFEHSFRGGPNRAHRGLTPGKEFNR